MRNKNPLRLGGVLCTVPMLVCWICLAGTAWSTTPDEALLRMEERRRDIAQQMSQSTVIILVTKDDELQSLGTGFVVADGRVLTNAHVVDAGDTWYVAGEGLPPAKAQLINRSYSEEPGVADFALLRCSTPSISPLTFNTQVGRMDRVSAWGYPYMVTQFDKNMNAIEQGNFEGMPPLVYTEGVVSALVSGSKSTNIIHTAAIAGGNSGGPLSNRWGEVVGINTWGYKEEDEGAFINAALPADKLVAFLRSNGVEPQLSQRGSSPLQAARTPHLSAPSSPPVASDRPPAQGSRRSIIPVPKETPNSLPQGLSEEIQEAWRTASQGDAEAQALVGYAYYSGDGAPTDTATAVAWLQKSVAQGNANAEHLLGIVRVFETSYKDTNKGLALLRKAADADPDYASMLAMLYLDGEYMGVERNAELCAVYARRGAEAGDADAVGVLAFLTYFGIGVEQNEEKALELARQAEKEGNSLAQVVLGWIYYSGDIVPVSVSRALSYATDAAESDEAHGMGLLACMYYLGEDKLPPDREKAEGWAVRAAERCNVYGQYILGMLYKDQESEEKQVEAWAYLNMAARSHVSAEEERDALTKKLTPAQLGKAKALSAKWLEEFGLPPHM